MGRNCDGFMRGCRNDEKCKTHPLPPPLKKGGEEKIRKRNSIDDRIVNG